MSREKKSAGHVENARGWMSVHPKENRLEMMREQCLATMKDCWQGSPLENHEEQTP